MKMVRTNLTMVNTKFKTGGLREKHVVATWNLGNHLSNLGNHLRLDYGRSPHAYVNQRLQIRLELLMTSGMPLETCWAVNERWNNELCYNVASCWLFLLSHTTMHGSMNIKHHLVSTGARGSAVGWGTALEAGRSRVRFPMVSLKFFIDIILPSALRPWGWLSL